MNLYRAMNEEQLNLVKETGTIIEDREYSADEIKKVSDNVASHIFFQSKKKINEERNKYFTILNILS